MALTQAIAGEFKLSPAAPSMDRWVYAYGDFLGDRQSAPTFASFDPRFDSRDGQFLTGWDTAALVATNAGPANYLIRRARLTVTIAADNAFYYDPTFDSFHTYDTNLAGYTPDLDTGRPAELYGAAFRNGFTDSSFAESSPFGPLNPINSGNISIGTRNAFAAMFGPDGQLLDVANNVGQHNSQWTNAPFEVRPWAIGLTTNTPPGELVPVDAAFTFQLDLTDPLIVGYLQRALDSGRLRLFITSLSPSAQAGGGGTGAYPSWATRENVLSAPPHLELDGTLVGPDDTDSDGLPDDWERYYFNNLTPGAADDSDQDGQSNGDELAAGTDPTLSSSVLRIHDAQYDADGNVTLRFGIAPSRAYRIERSIDLKEWHPAQGILSYPAVGEGEFVEQRINVPPSTPPQAFYRVQAE